MIPPFPMRKLLITLLLLMPLCASATGTPFSDVPPNFPYAQAITNLASNGVISGYSDGTFRPENPINRAEFTKIVTLYKFGADMVEKCGSHMQFSDLLFDAWYGKYICRAKDAHLIDGYPDGTFRPAQNINFSEAAKIIALTATLNAGDPILPSDDGGPWYSRYVRFLSEAHAIPTSIKSLDQVITRGEMAEMIWRLKDTQRNLPSNTYNNLTN